LVVLPADARRTPFGPGATWPVRVDGFLDDGVTPEQVERWVPSACVLCSNGCGLDIAVAGGRMVGVRGRADDRVNHGRLGPKGLFGWQANRAADRLTRPLVREGGELVERDWDTAMGRVVERSRRQLDTAPARGAAHRRRLGLNRLAGVPVVLRNG
jgi:anaerobic selenocysteine-containing dehydrogenase